MVYRCSRSRSLTAFTQYKDHLVVSERGDLYCHNFIITVCLCVSCLSSCHLLVLHARLELVGVFVGAHIKNISPNYPRDVLQMFDKRNMTITRSSAAAWPGWRLQARVVTRPALPSPPVSTSDWWPSRGPATCSNVPCLSSDQAIVTPRQTNWKNINIMQPARKPQQHE